MDKVIVYQGPHPCFSKSTWAEEKTVSNQYLIYLKNKLHLEQLLKSPECFAKLEFLVNVQTSRY